MGAQGGDEGRLGEGRAAVGRRGSGCRERRTGVGVGRGRSGRSPHSPPGGRRRRKSRSPCSGWGAAATGVQGPGMRAPGHRAAQGWGLRRPRRARADPGGVAPAGGDEGARRVASRAQCSRAGGSTAEQSWRCSSCGRRGGRGGRVAAGGGGGGEREPDPLPDLTPSSARVSGGRAGEPRGLSGNVVCGRREAEGAGAGAEHCGSSSPSSASEGHKGRLADSSPHRALRRQPGLWGRWLRDLRLPERGRCGGSRWLCGGGGAARVVAPRSRRGRGAGVTPAGGGGADGLGRGGRWQRLPSPFGLGGSCPFVGPWSPRRGRRALTSRPPPGLGPGGANLFSRPGYSGRLLLSRGSWDGGTEDLLVSVGSTLGCRVTAFLKTLCQGYQCFGRC